MLCVLLAKSLTQMSLHVRSLLLPARSDKTSCLPLRMVWLYEQVRARAIAVSKFNIGKRTALSDIERARERCVRFTLLKLDMIL